MARVPPLARVPPCQGPSPGRVLPLARVPPQPGYPPARVPPTGYPSPPSWSWQGTPPAGPGRVPPRLSHGILGNVAKHYGIRVPPPAPRCEQTENITFPHPSDAGGKNEESAVRCDVARVTSQVSVTHCGIILEPLVVFRGDKSEREENIIKNLLISVADLVGREAKGSYPLL